MKRLNYYIGFALICSTSLFSGCTSEDDPTNIEDTDNKLITIVANAPSIEDDSNKAGTRVDITDDDGLVLKWESTDVLSIRGFYIGKSGNFTGKDKSTTSITGPTSGTPSTTATFSFESYSESIMAYSVTIGNTGSGALTAGGWDAYALTTPQTQDCSEGKETDHLKQYYTAILKYIRASAISSGSGITFSQAWATTNKYVPQETPASGEPTSTDCGIFAQSSCLKMIFTLPTLPDDVTYDNIRKMEITTSRESSTGSTAKSFYSTNKGGSVTNSITLNFTNVPNNNSLTAYFMLCSAGLRVFNDSGDATMWNIKMYYGEGASDYIYKDIIFTKAITGTDAANKQGKLYKLTVNNTGWKKSDGTPI